MQGECLFCKQIVMVDDAEYEKLHTDAEKLKDLTEQRIKAADHVATMNCKCIEAGGYQHREKQLASALLNAEYICEGKKSLIQVAKQTVKLIARGNLKKAQFSFGGVVIRMSKGKEEIKVERIETTKESLES